MAEIIENYSKFEVHVVVRSLQTEGVSQSEIHRRLVGDCGWNICVKAIPVAGLGGL
jgi:hypothetical protein